LEPTKPAEEEDKTKSFAEYQKEMKSKRSVLKAKPARKANEGVDDSAWESAKLISKPEVDEKDDLAMLLQGSKKPSVQKKKERKEKSTVEIEVKFTQEPARRGGDDRRGQRGDRGGFRGGRGGAPRPSTGSYRPQSNKTPVNINDTEAFPSLS
jgi:plasminogen activator inhibitor 1 RNA-binding protein